MPVSVTYPGLYIEELPSSARTITPAPTSITAFVGYTHPFQGQCANNSPPLWNQAIQIFNFTEYERIFGGLYRSRILESYVADAVYQFFLNGGTNAYVVGLQPKNLTAASGTQSGIKFTAKHLTDATDANKVSITFSGVRRTDATNDTADILITYGSRVETFRNVLVKSGPPSANTAPSFIGNLSSEIVKIEPDAANGEYASSYTAASPAVVPPLELGAMMPLDPHYTAFDAQDFIEALAHNSSLDKVDIFNLLVIPGVADNAIWSAGLAFCERKLAFYIMDAPQNAAADDTFLPVPKIEDLLDTLPRGSPNGALYYPNLTANDPINSGNTVEQPPSGYVAGIYARTDTRRGVWKAPAGLETSLLNTKGPVEEGRMTDMRQGTLNPLGVNVLRSFPGSGTVVWGARTVSTKIQQQWRYVPVRRTALFIEQTLLRNLGWAVFEPNDEPLWTAIRISVEGFMLSLFRQAAFQGSTPSQAFRVQCDATTTTQTDINNGIVNIVVGFRPLKPAEFVVIKIAQLAGQVQ